MYLFVCECVWFIVVRCDVMRYVLPRISIALLQMHVRRVKIVAWPLNTKATRGKRSRGHRSNNKSRMVDQQQIQFV